ncbi:hypothetical protein JCM3774_002962 [Rhodotorula dairenensis]
MIVGTTSLLLGLAIIVVGFLAGILLEKRCDCGPRPPADPHAKDRYGNLKWIHGGNASILAWSHPTRPLYVGRRVCKDACNFAVAVAVWVAASAVGVRVICGSWQLPVFRSWISS